MRWKKLTIAVDRLSSRSSVRHGIYVSALIAFFTLILLPPLLGVVIKSGAMYGVLGKSEIVSRALTAIANSLIIALIVSVLNLVAGLPMAWLIARGKSKWLNVLDTIADLPFIVPTAVLGYSLLLFWSEPVGLSAFFDGSVIPPGILLVALLHFAFSFPVVVRVLVGALLDYKMEYELASRTLGAPPITAVRTVTLEIIKPSIIAAFTLAFARSLSETGATMMVAGKAFENGAVFIQNMKNAYSASPPLVSQAEYEGAAAFASILLIALSCIIFAAIRFMGTRFRLSFQRTWPTTERKLSYSKAVITRNAITLAIFFLIVIIPSLFVALPAVEALFTESFPKALTGAPPWNDYWESIARSYSVGVIVTILDIIIGLPMAVVVARKRLGKSSSILNILVDIPIIIPSVALGASLRFFWKETLAYVPEIWLLIFAHMAITYPYFVRSMAAAIERISVELEEASRTLGAKPFGVFRTIIFPLTKYSLFSGAIIVFTRSVSETGATLAVTDLKTAPVVLVNWVKGGIPVSPAEVGLGCGFLIVISFVILLTLRLIVRGKGRY
ncbi:MAG: ABC transporter permease subunit [Candidatus Bathyarchaeota archaeon]|nr:ABC transporter permease subunit [Candidatus Bathyarchaeota archaeon]